MDDDLILEPAEWADIARDVAGDFYQRVPYEIIAEAAPDLFIEIEESEARVIALASGPAPLSRIIEGFRAWRLAAYRVEQKLIGREI